ncbi:hypothetical protein JCM33374_g5817 [Metschnikowia sp. JCM 33374]|nr:hypothetical protein JCM33374_g5817 [Metschnikowia sp. JCM 33374]
MSEKNGTIPQSGNGLSLKFEPKFIDSLDARIIQYKYALVKLDSLIRAIDVFISETVKTSTKLVLIHHIIYLASNLFAINESGFFPKLEALENFKVPKSPSVATSSAVTHIPYDMRDQNVVPLINLPHTASSISCLKAFRVLCLICQDAYQKRFANASKEIDNDEYLEDLDSLFTKSFFDLEKDFDIVLKSSLFGNSSLDFQLDPEMTASGDYSEASLIDIDICSLFTIISETSRMLNAQKPAINKYRIIKQSPKTLQERHLKDTPYSAYALHRVFFWALRINELYFILRKFGRQIFISNYDHLHDQKFMSFVNNGLHYRDMLKEIDENFFNTKKNGVLIATITRFLRMDSKNEICAKSIFDFVGFIHQSVAYLEGLIKTLREFGYAWLSSEIAFRNSHNLPIENLLKLNDIVEGQKVNELKVKRVRGQPLTQANSKLTAPPTMKTPLSRQSSISRSQAPKPRANESSPASTSDVNKYGTTEEAPKIRANLVKKSAEAQSPFYLQRHSSVTSLQSNSSSSSLTEKPTVGSPTAAVRRRASSQPISYNAAAAALKGNGVSTPAKQEYTVRSPNDGLRRTNSVTKKSSSPSVMSPLSNKRPVMDVVEEKKEASPPKIEVKRTASQKFQQHLMEAARSGALYSKEKEVMSNVIFDPNNPSATNLRRQAKPKSQESSPLKEETPPLKLNVPPPIQPMADKKPIRAEVAPPQSSSVQVPIRTQPMPPQPIASRPQVTPAPPLADQKPTRAQITKLNTRRNSVIIQSNNRRLSEASRNSINSTSTESSPVDSIIVKKVRFIGVPEYSPAEDAPTSQTNRILKNFASLKLSAARNAGVRRKDDAFKQEESQLFKQHLEGEPSTIENKFSAFAPGSQITSRFARFKNRF